MVEDISKLIMVIIIILLVAGGVYLWAFPKLTDYYYNKGVTDGYIAGQYNLLNDVCTDGAVNVNVNGTLQAVPINQMCGGS